MKLIVGLLSVATAMTAAGQTATHAPARKATAAPATQAPHCVPLPEASPKIPALGAGASCAEVLYTLRVDPPVKIAYVAPIEGTALQDTLGLTEESFSLLYVDSKVGTGELAQPKKWYSIRYTGYLPDGTVFDSNADKTDEPPFSFPYGSHQVISGWDTGFAGMRVGGKRRLFIPYQLAYGANGRPPKIPPKSMLIFDVEFVGQSDAEPQRPAPPAPPAASHQAPAGTSSPETTAPQSSAPKPPQ